MKNKLYIYSLLIYLISFLPSYAQSESTNHLAEYSRKVHLALKPVIDGLFAWPDQATLSGSKQIKADAPEVLYAKTQCQNWLNIALDPSWLPTTNVETYFLKNEFAERDVVRTTWQTHSFRVEVSQTESVFAIKLIPLRPRKLGEELPQKIQAASDLSAQCFNKTSRYFDWHKFNSITNLVSLIQSCSFISSEVKMATNGTVYRELQPLIKRFKQENVDIPWIMTARSYEYWFRNIYWWNNGQQIGFYFPKSEGYGAIVTGEAGFFYRSDKNFFRQIK